MFNLPQMFDGMVAIDDSNWYIKRLNNMEIDKKKSVILGCYIKIIGWEDFDPPPPILPFHIGPQSAVPIPLIHMF